MSEQHSTRARRRAHSDKREPDLAVVPARPGHEPGGSGMAAAAAARREITFPGLILTLRRGLWLLAATVLACVILAAVALKLREPVYTATLVVAPADRDLGAASRLAAELDQYAGLATLAQVPAKLEQVAPIERYTQILGSVPLAERLEREHQMLRQVFVAQWDEARGSWQPPPGVFETIRRSVLEFFGFPGWTEPGPATLAQYLQSNIIVSRQGTSALRQLSFEHPDGAFAADLLTTVHATADDMLRREALARVRQQIEQVEQTLAEAPAGGERRAALEGMLADQYQVEALLAADVPYAAEVVSPASAGPAPSSMSPILVLALAAVVGVIAGTFLVFLRDALRPARS